MPYYNYPNYSNYNSPYAQPQSPMTNKIYVTSSEDALSRFAIPNTITVYFLQDESTLFEVVTDVQGKKNIRARKLVDIAPQKEEKSEDKAPMNNYITREEFDEFKATLATKNTKKKVVDDE